MALEISRLQMVKRQEDGTVVAQCPACAEEGGDRAGVHLIVFPDDAFACVVHPGDGAHRRVVYALAGAKNSKASLPGNAGGGVRARLSRDENFKRHFRAAMPSILRNSWDRPEMSAGSPVAPPTDAKEGARALLTLFPAGDVVWVGDHKDSGQPRHAAHFRPAAEWIGRRFCPAGPRICPAAFRPGGFSRCQAAVEARRFLVVESDCLSYGEQGAIFRWLRGHLRLRAVVDTAGRSLHGWFDAPGPGLLREIKMAFECIWDGRAMDPALFNPAQPCRLPGWPRSDSGAVPRLIYFDP
jgi:hypothetical protein